MFGIQVDLIWTSNTIPMFSPQQKYFDSGDYAMAKAKLSAKQKPMPPPEIIKAEDVGQTIPTPENIQARKPSLVTSKLASGAELL